MASYERGERQISLERFFALAEVYEVAPERIVAAIAHELEVADEQVEAASSRDSRRPEVEVLEPFVMGAPHRR